MEIDFRPPKKMIIEQIIKEPMNTFLTNTLSIMPPPPMYWAEGILFTFGAAANLPDDIKKHLWETQTYVFQYINFTEKKEYEDTVVHPTNGMKASVFDVTHNDNLVELAKWVNAR